MRPNRLISVPGAQEFCSTAGFAGQCSERNIRAVPHRKPASAVGISPGGRGIEGPGSVRTAHPNGRACYRPRDAKRTPSTGLNPLGAFAMPQRPATPCSTPGCTLRADQGGRCLGCAKRRARAKDSRRGTASDRGYGLIWRARRLDFLVRHHWCKLCGHVARVADHYPTSRRELLERGIGDPDTDEYLRPLCKPCHDRETARHQPGGWNH